MMVNVNISYPAGLHNSTGFRTFCCLFGGTRIYGNDLHGRSGWPNLDFLSKLCKTEIRTTNYPVAATLTIRRETKM